MSSAYGPGGPSNLDSAEAPPALRQSLEVQLFESLVHHLIEKGVLTRNDALSVVQTVAQVKRGAVEEQPGTAFADNGLAVLKRLYSSFELMPERRLSSQDPDDGNVLELRPPLHGNRPKFAEDN